MLLILLSWIYIFLTSYLFGISFSKGLRIQQPDVVTTTILGLFSITVLATIWAFFGPISIAFHIALLLLSLLFWFKSKASFTLVLQDALRQIKLLSLPIKVFLTIGSLLLLAQSATLPFIIDNESYYIQTIKWLNEYGFVKGLANLHLFFGQTSGWHITQSVYSFSFLYDKFNDLNGFCLLLGNFFAFQKLNSYFVKGNQMDLVFGLIPLTYVFLFQFVNAPSPDLPIYVFGLLLFSNYLQNENKKDRFTIISILAIYTVFIKITAVILLLIPLWALIQNFTILKRQFLKIGLIGGFVFGLFISKNTILTGYPLFPLLNFRMDSLDYSVPSIVMDFFFSKGMLHSFYIVNSEFYDMSVLDMIKHYFFNNGLCGYIGILSVLILLISPVVIVKRQIQKSVWGVYFAFVVLTILLCFSSPQYRFYIYFSLFFALLLASLWLTNPKWILRFISLSFVLIGFLLLIPMTFNTITDNKLLGQNSTLTLKNIIVPESNSKWKSEYKGGGVGNMTYHTPIDTSFFWVTGNGELPCVNSTQLDYFQKGFFYIPQQRSIDLSDGFYSQKVSGNE